MRSHPVTVKLSLLTACLLLLSTEAAAQGGATQPASSASTPISLPSERSVTVASPESERTGLGSPRVPGSVTLTLPPSSRVGVARINVSDVRLKSERVVLQTNDKIPDLLEAGGIRPDVNALS